MPIIRIVSTCVRRQSSTPVPRFLLSGNRPMQPSETTYQLPPFPAFPAISRYVPLGSLQEAFARVCRSIDANDMLSLVIGPPGTGKTLLAGLLAQHYRGSHDVVVLGETRMNDQQSFLRHLLHHLKVDLTNVRDSDLQLAVMDRVCRDDAPAGGLLIIVDEAQSLSPEVFESIRMVTNIMHHGIPRVATVICGGTKLDDLLIETSMESFTQRIATRCYLHPLNGEETRRYIRETIRQCGADPDATISDDAITTVYHACSGFPRLINQLMTQAIDCAEEADQSMISERIIDLAWSQLQQLPSPVVEEPRLASHSSDVEFGELDEVATNDDLDESSTEERSTAECNLADSRHATNASTDVVPAISQVDRPSPTASAEGSADWWFDDEVMEQDEASFAATLGEIETESSHDLSANVAGDTSSNRPVLDESFFGEFDEEEQILLGAEFKGPQSRKPTETIDLESVLHREIVGLSEYLSDALLSIEEGEAELDCMESIDEEPLGSGEPDEVVEDFVASPADSLNDVSIAMDESDCLQADETGEADQATAATGSGSMTGKGTADGETRQPSCSIVSIVPELGTDVDGDEPGPRKHDDSDLLVIEDEVEMRRIDAAKRYDSLEKTISVDFQAMLSRMRSGAKDSHA